MKKPEIRKKILKFIKTSKERRGFPPTVREIAAYMGFVSPSTAHYHLRLLMKEGLLKFRYKKVKRSARGIKLRYKKSN
ncbi:MAG: hypothetical protein CVU80_01695 [Elusimicrobia bacterium HGW-Elusimicrobia-4]|nr:MAG: hypothetical protein CVU80_01695 [Elusimicrobia bacterium HGW-Elusimicrobia-4]